MNRTQFLQNSLLLTGATALATTDQMAFAANLVQNPFDKLAGADGFFVHNPLPYAENALEPWMDAETLHLHHTFHHGNAVKAANDYLKKIRAGADAGNFEYTDYWTKKMSLQSSSHILHSIFWTNLTAKKSEPTGALRKQIETQYKSYDAFKGLVSHLSKTVDGNGWGILGFQPFTGQLVLLQVENHEKLTQWGVVPLLVVDVWEHAYYLKFRNRRNEFVDNLFNIINWGNVADRYDKALKIIG
jgi:superoxide dismutase, Fe-Mn family